MARFLYRLGHFSARRPLAVVLAWLTTLGALAAAMVAFQAPLSNAFTLPGSEYEKVLTDLETTLPDLAGGQATVVLTADKAFTKAQRKKIKETMKLWEKSSGVSQVLSPFAIQKQIDSSAQLLRDERKRAMKGKKQVNDARYQIQGGRKLARDGRRDIARLEATAPSDETLPARKSGQFEIERQLADAEKQLADAKKELSDGFEMLGDAERLFELGENFGLLSDDGATALVTVVFEKQLAVADFDDLSKIAEVGKNLEGSGVQADYSLELTQPPAPGGIAEVIGLVVAGVVLLLMLGSVLASSLPLASALVGVGVAVTGALSFSGQIEIQQLSPVMGSMLGLAVGIDYSLFVVNRHRNQVRDMLQRGEEPSAENLRESIAKAMGTAGSAVMVAAATVILSLAALLVVNIPGLQQMGGFAAITVFVTALVSLTLTPALLSLLGMKLFSRSKRRELLSAAEPARDGKATQIPQQRMPQDQHRQARRWVDFTTKNPAITVIAVVVFLGIAALPALQLRLGLPDGGSEPEDSTAFRAFEVIENEFGAGANGPILAVTTFSQPIKKGDEVKKQLQVVEAVATLPRVDSIVPVETSKDRRTMAFQIIPKDGPSAQSTVNMVHGLRTDVREALAAEDISMGVAGLTVAYIEVSDRLTQALPLYLAVVIGLSLILLTIVFRSLVVPLVATAGFLLSLGAAFGAVVAIYQFGWMGSVFEVNRSGPVFSFMPTLVIGVLFGLAMDYQFFLVTGMREAYVHGKRALPSVTHGFINGSKVVVAAAMIMVCVFAGFIFNHMTMSRPIALGLTVGVFVDAFVIRLTFTPAVMALLGDKAWYMPAWLDQLLPHVDVEGSSLVDAEPDSPAPVEPPRPTKDPESVLESL